MAQDKIVLGVLPIFYQILQDLHTDGISVMLLENAPTDPHYFNLNPAQLMQIQKADFVLCPTEWKDRLGHYAKNAKGIESALHDHESHNAIAFLHELVSESPLRIDSDFKRTLSELSHEWMSFSGLKLLYRVAKDALTELNPEKKEEISSKYLHIIQTIDELEKTFSRKNPWKQSIFYHNDFWILQHELQVSFGPSLYSCDDDCLSPEDLILLTTQSDQYAFFIADAHMNHQSLKKIFDYMNSPLKLRTIDSLGQIKLSGPQWLETQLQVIYNDH